MTEKNVRIAALKAAFPKTIPVMTGYLFLGITYGILMTTSGFSFVWPMVTSLLLYTGSMEFLMVRILASSFSPASAFATTILVCARHIFYGISMLEKYRNVGFKKFYMIYTTSDETFAVNYSADIPEGIDRGWFYFWVSFLDQMYWFTGSTFGGLVGGLIPFDTKGLDFVMTAMFLVIFMEQWCKDGLQGKTLLKDHVSELIGLLGSIVCLVVFGPDRFTIPTMIVILVCLAIMKKVQERRKEA